MVQASEVEGVRNTKGYPTGQQVSWMRQSRRTEFGVGNVEGKSLLMDLGSDMVSNYPLYDNGMYFVIDDVAEVRFVVMRWGDEAGINMNRPVTSDIDKYEAIRLADQERELELAVDE